MKPRNSNADGVRVAWKLWRHCLCRHGWYPLIVAPFISISGLLDIYSSVECRFIRINIGFDPLNEEWSDSVIEAGFWNHYNKTEKFLLEMSYEKNYIIPGCTQYSNDFTDYFIRGDRAWAASRVMAMSSGISSAIAICTIWLMTLCPLPACFVWPGILLPSVLLGFLTGGAKLFILDSAICNHPVWLKEESVYRVTSESCELGMGAKASIASVCCYFLCICLIFYDVPTKRILDPHFCEDIIEDSDSVNDIERLDATTCANSHSRDSSLEQISEHHFTEQIPFPSKNKKKYEVRGMATPRVTNAIYNKRARDKEEDGDDLESVMAKIGFYLKESGSQLDFENSFPKSNSKKDLSVKSQIHESSSLPERRNNHPHQLPKQVQESLSLSERRYSQPQHLPRQKCEESHVSVSSGVSFDSRKSVKKRLFSSGSREFDDAVLMKGHKKKSENIKISKESKVICERDNRSDISAISKEYSEISSTREGINESIGPSVTLVGSIIKSNPSIEGNSKEKQMARKSSQGSYRAY